MVSSLLQFSDKMANNDSSDGLLLILSGIPGSGKTTFAQKLMHQKWQVFDKCLHFTHISYDDFIPENSAFNQSSTCATDHGWKASRRQILHGVEKLILQSAGDECNAGKVEVDSSFQQKIHFVSKPCQCGVGHMTRADNIFHVIVIDDNMYYRSMRYEYYQLARKVCFGFVEMVLFCPLDVALHRNTARPQPVSKETIIKMIDRIEMPEPAKFPWEKYSMVIDTCTSVSDDQWQTILKLICESSCDIPLALPVLNEEEKAKDKAITQQNILHQADQIIRKYISSKLNLMKGSASKSDIKQTAENLNRKRKIVMERIKKDPLEFAKEILNIEHFSFCLSIAGNLEKEPFVKPEHEYNNELEEHDIVCENMEHFWDVVSLEDFSAMVKRFFENWPE